MTSYTWSLASSSLKINKLILGQFRIKTKYYVNRTSDNVFVKIHSIQFSYDNLMKTKNKHPGVYFT